MSTKDKELVMADENTRLLIDMGIVKFKADFEATQYASICGSYVEGCLQWCTHNVEDVAETENKKYVGWTVEFNDGRKDLKMYIEKSILKYMKDKCKDWKHAKNTFLKFLKEKI